MKKWPRTSLVIIWLQLSWVRGEDKVMQSPLSVVVQEEGSATLNCSYEVTNFQSLFWYKQQENAPTFLLRQISNGIEKSGRLKGTLDKKERLGTLHITATQLGDSATYLCAVETQCCLLSCSPYPNAPAGAPATVRWGSCYTRHDPKSKL
uniref:T cell receptor alpha variable 36/delta variable 7 n=1 Tax=Suricata suricatta TaxID=37032 RepID=A0A673THC7_SURSU